MRDRLVDWPGFYNARDLGGLPLVGGGETAYGGYVRSADLRFATPEGLERMRAAGIGTVVDLRNDFETGVAPKTAAEVASNAQRIAPSREAVLPEGVFGVRVPLDDYNNDEFERFFERMEAEGRVGSPRFFGPLLREQPARVVAVLRVLAQAPGGVLFHCAVGRDRTGLISFTLLALAGVEPEAIAADYALSAPGLAPFFERVGFPNQAEGIAARLAGQGHTLESAVLEALNGLDLRQVLLAAGLTEAELDRLRGRLVA